MRIPSAYNFRVDDPDLPILGTEPLVVEFANSLYDGDDLLSRRWFTAAGSRPARDLTAARALRDSIRALFMAAVDTADRPAAAITHVNAAAALAPTYPHLTTGPQADRRTAATGDASLLGGLATACIDLLTDGRAQLLRRCATPDCCLLFVQHHRRRRYCHESCAHRDRQSRYQRRRRTET